MAVLLQVRVTPATQDQYNQLDDMVGQSMDESGGPPAGLMSHVVYPEADGFVIADVWRSLAEGATYIDDVLRRLVSDAGLNAEETTVHPVWSFARPLTPAATR